MFVDLSLDRALGIIGALIAIWQLYLMKYPPQAPLSKKTL